MAGEGRLCSALNALKRTDGVELLVKTGAEGVYCAALPGLGLGVALKAEDGATRASEAALMAVLDRMGLFDLVRPETRPKNRPPSSSDNHELGWHAGWGRQRSVLM